MGQIQHTRSDVSSDMLPFIRRAAPLVAALATVATIVACDDNDARTKRIEPGADRDSAMRILSDGKIVDSSRMPPPGALIPASDTLKNVWRRAEYLIKGHRIEVLYYSPNDEKWRPTDTIPKEKVIPVVIIDGKVYGTGRSAYKDAMNNFGLPDAKY